MPNEGPEQVGDVDSKLHAAQLIISEDTFGHIRSVGFHIYSLYSSVVFSTFSVLILWIFHK